MYWEVMPSRVDNRAADERRLQRGKTRLRDAKRGWQVTMNVDRRDGP